MNRFSTSIMKKTLIHPRPLFAAVVMTVCAATQVMANDDANSTEAPLLDTEKFSTKLGLQVLQVESTAWPGMVVVMTDRGIFYTNRDASLLIQGNMYDITAEPVSETDKFKAQYLTKALPKMKDQWIEFTAPEEKQVLYVYTSPSCGYCKKLHNEIDEYLNAGVTIRYLAMPRAGVQSEEFKTMSNTWCKDNKVEKFNNMMSGVAIEADTECSSSLSPHLALAQNLSISSTPAIISESGNVQMGYRPFQETINSLAN